MLQEILGIAQNEGEPFRRLFADPDFSLYVWFRPDGKIRTLELCYDKQNNERVLRWKDGSGYLASRVDAGASHPLEYKQSAMLVPGGAFEKTRVLPVFRVACGALDPALAAFVLKILSEAP